MQLLPILLSGYPTFYDENQTLLSVKTGFDQIRSTLGCQQTFKGYEQKVVPIQKYIDFSINQPQL